MLGLGRYSQHQKLNTEPENSYSFDTDLGSQDEKDYTVLYLGEEPVETIHNKNYSNIVRKIYGETFSPLNAMIQSKKLSLNVCEDGITISTPGRHTTKRVFKKFSIPSLVYLSSDTNHKKVLAVVCQNQDHVTSLSLFVCEEDTVPSAVMDECMDKLNREYGSRKIVGITKSTYPVSIHIQYEDSKENGLCVESNSEFGEFKSSRGTTHPTVQSPDLNTDLDLDDEFSQLALKRNNALPDHLQDKTIESACLIQSNQPKSPMEEQTKANTSFFKSNFFSSYSRVSSGSS